MVKKIFFRKFCNFYGNVLLTKTLFIISINNKGNKNKT